MALGFGSKQNRHGRKTGGEMITRHDEIHTEGVWAAIGMRETTETQAWRFLKPSWKQRHLGENQRRRAHVAGREQYKVSDWRRSGAFGRMLVHLGVAWEDPGDGLGLWLRKWECDGIEPSTISGTRIQKPWESEKLVAVRTKP